MAGSYLPPGSILILPEKSDICIFVGNLRLNSLPLMKVLKLLYWETPAILELCPAHESPPLNA